LPKIISNPNGTEGAPEGTTEIQVGFVYALNYPFVVATPYSSAQIFKYLPIGIAAGLGIKPEQVTMKSLIPLDTTRQMNFVTTLALAWIPTNMVSTLSLDLHIPNSDIYRNPDASVFTLMNYINPAIPLTPGSTLDNGATTTGSTSAASSSAASGNSGVFNDSGSTTSSGVSGTTAGIAMAAIGGSAAYGAAMFLIARRYKKRKQNHRRSSSLNYSEMRQSGSPALMGGAYMTGGRTSAGHDRNSRGSGRTGNSARTAQISAPMMAENSLGWN
jgi:hypothetical protein